MYIAPTRYFKSVCDKCGRSYPSCPLCGGSLCQSIDFPVQDVIEYMCSSCGYAAISDPDHTQKQLLDIACPPELQQFARWSDLNGTSLAWWPRRFLSTFNRLDEVIRIEPFVTDRNRLVWRRLELRLVRNRSGRRVHTVPADHAFFVNHPSFKTALNSSNRQNRAIHRIVVASPACRLLDTILAENNQRD